MLPYPDIQTYLLSPQLRDLSLDLMGASPSSIPPEIFQIFFLVVTLMPDKAFLSGMRVTTQVFHHKYSCDENNAELIVFHQVSTINKSTHQVAHWNMICEQGALLLPFCDDVQLINFSGQILTVVAKADSGR